MNQSATIFSVAESIHLKNFRENDRVLAQKPFLRACRHDEIDLSEVQVRGPIRLSDLLQVSLQPHRSIIVSVMGGVIGRRKAKQSEPKWQDQKENSMQTDKEESIDRRNSNDSICSRSTQEENSFRSLQDTSQAGSSAKIDWGQTARSDGVASGKVVGKVQVVRSGWGSVDLGYPSEELSASHSPPAQTGRQRSLSEDFANMTTITDSTRRAYAVYLREMSNSTEHSEPSAELQEILSQVEHCVHSAQPAAAVDSASPLSSLGSSSRLPLIRQPSTSSSASASHPLNRSASLGARELSG